MLEVTIAFAPDGFINHKRLGIAIGPLSRVSTSQSYVFRCQDGGLFAVHLSIQTKFWEGLLERAGAAGPCAASATSPSGRTASATTSELRDELAKTCLTRPRAEWDAAAEADDVPYAPVLSPARCSTIRRCATSACFYRASSTRAKATCAASTADLARRRSDRVPRSRAADARRAHRRGAVGAGLRRGGIAELRARRWCRVKLGQI